jgi:hypothetical protein
MDYCLRNRLYDAEFEYMYREFCYCHFRYYNFIYVNGIISALLANPLLTEVQSGAATSVITRANSLGSFALDNIGTDSQQQRVFVFCFAVFRRQFLLKHSNFTNPIHMNLILPLKSFFFLFTVLHDKITKNFN